MKIAIEGMDGSGKTTLAKSLAKLYGYTYIDKPFKFIFDGLNLDEKQIKEIEWKLYETNDEALITTFYGLGLLYGTRNIDGENFIYDRHFVSNYYWHGTEENEKLHDVFLDLCGKPDLTILLKASVETRIKRISIRDNKDPDLINSAMYDYGYDKMVKYLCDKNYNYIIIDTDGKTKDEVLHYAINAINGYLDKIVKKEK